MNAAVDDTSDQPQQPEGPGGRLKKARLAAGFDLERMAAQLHITPGQVSALEADQYESFAARVFVRGYLRNYARVVGEPVDAVLAQFDHLWPDGEGVAQLKRVGSERPQLGSGHGIVRLVSWALLLGIVVLFLVWWAGYLQIHDGDLLPIDGDGTEQPASVPAEPAAPTAVAPGEVSLPPSPTAISPVAEPATPPDAAAEVDPVQDEAPAAPPSQDAATDAQTPAEPAAVPDLAPQVVLSLTGPCWLQVIDASGKYRLTGEYKAGFREVLGGTPPYRILLGNAPAATLTVDGQPVDLAPHSRGQVARLTLNPDAQ